MEYDTLQFDLQDHVAWTTRNRLAALNALNLHMARELYDVANRCGAGKAVRAFAEKRAAAFKGE